MRAPTILCWYTSTFLSFHLTSAAPGGKGGGREGVAVAIDFGTVTEKFPLPDASQQQQVVAATTLQREQKISKSQRPEPVRLWIDDFGNIEAVPVVSKDGLDDDDSSSSSSSTEKSAPAPAPIRGSASSSINQQPPPSQPLNPQKKNHHLAPPAPAPAPAPRQQRQLQDRTTKGAIITWKWPSTFSGVTGILYFVFGSILLLGGLITLALSLSTRRRNIRILGMGHRRGRSRFSL